MVDAVREGRRSSSAEPAEIDVYHWSGSQSVENRGFGRLWERITTCRWRGPRVLLYFGLNGV